MEVIEGLFRYFLGMFLAMFPKNGESNGQEHGKIHGNWCYIGGERNT